MVDGRAKRLNRKDWIQGALELLSTAGGMEGVKIVPLAEQLGVTSGSFYWHFKNRRDLYDALVEYWEREMTDTAIEAAKLIESPKERIWSLMEQVMATGMARYDLAFWHWAQTEPTAREAFQRTLSKRFAFAKWMFMQAGFNSTQAEARGRMMVVYMMGESTLIPAAPNKRKMLLRLKYEILTSS